ncbi:MAG: ABC transporter permease [Lachnospiraceae bacterium]|nr:ABC transporter permease [Lachnospiraceae bacterium]
MYRLFFIAKNNMKKQKGDMITFFIMTFIASFMIFTCVNLLLGTFKILDTNQEQINGTDTLFMVYNEDPISLFKLKEIMQGDENIEKIEENKFLSANAKFRKKGTKKWSDYSFHFCSYEEERTIQTTSIDVSHFSGNEIVLPIAMSTSYRIGDIIEIKISDNEYDFKVVGFNEDFIYCSSMNLGSYLCFISEKAYSEIEFENPVMVRSSKHIKGQLSKEAKANNVSADDTVNNMYNELNAWILDYKKVHPEYEGEFSGNFIPAELMKMSSMITPFMFIAMVLVLAVIVLAIALVVIDFSVKNFIASNIKNTGIMEAAGYTVKQLMLILLVQLLSISFAGSVAGAVIGGLSSEKIGYIMLFLLGLEWNQPINYPLMIAVIVLISLTIGAFAIVLGREYKKISVLDALRGGMNTHNYKKNVFPLDKTNLPMALTLALKETFGKFRGQIGVIVIMAVLGFSAAMGIGIYDSIGKDTDALLRISGLELYDAAVDGDQNMKAEIFSLPMVNKEKSYSEAWMAFEFITGKKKMTLTTRVIDGTDAMNPDLMVEGRWPKYDNEVALGTNAIKSLGLEVGDTIKVKNGEEEASYLVTGSLQTFNNMGQMGYMTKEGYEKIGKEIPVTSININLKDGYKFKDFENQIKDMYPDIEVVDIYASVGSLMTMLTVSMKAVLAIIMLVSSVIVALAVALIVRTKITKEWRNLGVNKALGFTSSQLITQIILSNLPAILIGVSIGLILATIFGSKLLLGMFLIFGFKKVPFYLSPISYVVVVVMMVGVAMIVSWINGQKIKNLEPVKMITEE